MQTQWTKIRHPDRCSCCTTMLALLTYYRADVTIAFIQAHLTGAIFETKVRTAGAVPASRILQGSSTCLDEQALGKGDVCLLAQRSLPYIGFSTPPFWQVLGEAALHSVTVFGSLQ